MALPAFGGGASARAGVLRRGGERVRALPLTSDVTTRRAAERPPRREPERGRPRHRLPPRPGTVPRGHPAELARRSCSPFSTAHSYGTSPLSPLAGGKGSGDRGPATPSPSGLSLPIGEKGRPLRDRVPQRPASEPCSVD